MNVDFRTNISWGKGGSVCTKWIGSRHILTHPQILLEDLGDGVITLLLARDSIYAIARYGATETVVGHRETIKIVGTDIARPDNAAPDQTEVYNFYAVS